MDSTSDLKAKRCGPCEGGHPPLSQAQIDQFLPQVPEWRVTDAPRLTRTFRFRDFREAMQFVNRMAEIAEAEGHHPDFFVHWNEVRVELWTHATGGLHENDFILAAKIDPLPAEVIAEGIPSRWKRDWKGSTARG